MEFKIETLLDRSTRISVQQDKTTHGVTIDDTSNVKTVEIAVNLLVDSITGNLKSRVMMAIFKEQEKA